VAGHGHLGEDPHRQQRRRGTGVLRVFGFFETVPFTVIGQGLHRAPAFLGVLEAVMGVGALAGGALAAPVMRRTGSAGPTRR
jgi:hypothetical protein